MKKQFSDIGLDDLALVGGGRRRGCDPKPCNPCDDPCSSKLTMSTAPSSAGLATVPGGSSARGGLQIEISIGGFGGSSADGGESLPGDPSSSASVESDLTSTGLPGTAGIAT